MEVVRVQFFKCFIRKEAYASIRHYSHQGGEQPSVIGRKPFFSVNFGENIQPSVPNEIKKKNSYKTINT